MKLIFALILWFVFAATLSTGLVLGVKHQSWWLLLISVTIFGVLFARIGCRSH